MSRLCFFCGWLALLLTVCSSRAADEETLNSFVIAPMIAGFGLCDAASDQPSPELMLARCLDRQDYGVFELQRELDKIEPNGAAGRVQIGYTLGVNLLEINDDRYSVRRFRSYAQALKNIKRPMVLYLFANHFAADRLDRDHTQDSLARFADQSILKDVYFDGKVIPLSLSMARDLGINQKRYTALSKIGSWYKRLPARSQRRIIAITMAGELHHFYDDFTNGMGRFDDIRVTDYSPESVRSFQVWLENKYASIANLNKILHSDFGNFSQVNPPHKDINKLKLNHFSEHFDSYAHGQLPIEGWLDELPKGHVLAVFLDGKRIGVAETGLSRQDVYEAIASIKTAGVGFRYWLDFSDLPRGKHLIQVIVEGANSFELARRNISVMGNSQAPIINFGKYHAVKPISSGTQFWLDRPANDQALFYNPLAKDWYDFRSEQVKLAYNTWFDWSIKNGLPAEKLYSHQIAVATNGGWNPVLAASDASLRGMQRYKKGINVYAGSANVGLLRKHYLNPGENYGVPEFHTLAWKDPAVPLSVLRDFQAGGASFVSPYFLSLVPDKFHSKQPNPHDKFELSPSNRNYGSDYLYNAIRDMAKE